MCYNSNLDMKDDLSGPAAQIAQMLAQKENFIIKCRWLAPLAKECAEAGFAGKPVIYDHARINVENGIIADVGNFFSRHDFKSRIIDCGDALVTAPLVNAHTHLQLSWLGTSVKWRNGFAEWLKSFVPQLIAASREKYDGSAERINSLEAAYKDLVRSGVLFVGDVGGTLPNAISCIARLARAAGLEISHFCEWFGYNSDMLLPWPVANRAYLENFQTEIEAAPCGHALYSTSFDLLRNLKNWCARENRPFTFHLAECVEETELLTSGSGALFNYYENLVLPENWRPPGKTPVRLAHELGLLDRNTLAVHCVQCGKNDIELLAESNCNVCLCPRSNNNLKVGEAPVKDMLKAGLKPCLGTDGLSSNTDLDVRKEAEWLIMKQDISPWDVLEMLTLNGFRALGKKMEKVCITRGNRIALALLDPFLYGLK